jgi:CRISPR-associated protein Cmr1
VTYTPFQADFSFTTRGFLSGADQLAGELRVPSLRGALRFWWRALAWSRVEGEVEALRSEESALFGSTERQSAFLLALSLSDSPRQAEKNSVSRWPQDRSEPCSPSNWRAYIGYGLLEKGERKQFPSGTSFKVDGMLKPDVPAANREELLRTFQALGLLGGLGGRARKGWGSLCLQELRVGDAVVWSAPTDKQAFEERVAALLKPTTAWSQEPPYSAFWRDAEVVVGPPQPDADAAHALLATLYCRAAKGQAIAQRKLFGLPRKPNSNRRASPLLLHVHQMAKGALPVATLFPAQFLPDQPSPSSRDWQPLRAFLHSLKDAE